MDLILGQRSDLGISLTAAQGQIICTYPIHSSLGSKPAGLHTNGDARKRSSSSELYMRAMMSCKKVLVYDRECRVGIGVLCLRCCRMGDRDTRFSEIQDKSLR